MASKSTVFRITHAKNYTDPWDIAQEAADPRTEAARISDLFERIACGLEPCTFKAAVGGTALATASATATIVTAVATNSVTINGVAFAAVAYNATPSGNQWCVGNGAGADTTSATNLAAAINAATTAKIKGYVRATSAAGVVTVSAFHSGLLGNLTTFTASGAPITVTGSGFLTGGAGDDVTSTSYDRS